MLKRIFYLILLCGNLFYVPELSAKSQEITINGDHSKLAAILQTPDNVQKYPLVIIMHGFASQKEAPLLKQIADNLEAAKIASIRFDFNGHGASGGRFQDMTILNEIEDAKRVYEYARNLPEVTSVGLSGHSQGGVVASMLAGDLGADQISALALLAPASVIHDNARNSEFFGIYYEADFLPEYIEIFGRRIGRNYLLTARDLPIYETAKKYQGSVLVLHGEADDIVPYTYGEKYHHIYKNSELKLLPNFDHNFTQNMSLAAKIISDYFNNKLH